jgi:hypothetical protein
MPTDHRRDTLVLAIVAVPFWGGLGALVWYGFTSDGPPSEYPSMSPSRAQPTWTAAS